MNPLLSVNCVESNSFEGFSTPAY